MRRSSLLLLHSLALVGAGCPRQGTPAAREPQALSALALPAVGAWRYRPGDLRGEVVLVSFFATWCFPCLANLPVLEKLQKDHGGRGFTVVAVGLDLEGAKVLEPWAAQYALPFPVLVSDDRLRDGESPFGRITSLPTTFLLDREGGVLLAYQGVASPEQLFEAVARAVER